MRRLEPTCDRCHRVLNWPYVEEFGPTCPECLVALGAELPQEEPQEPEPAVYVAPKVERKRAKATEPGGWGTP